MYSNENDTTSKTSNETFEINNYLFTCDHNSSLWFPCIQSTNELCTWKIEITLPKDYTCITSGDFIEKIANNDEETFHFYLSVPTCASNIGIVIGKFEMIHDENMNEITNYCVPKLLPMLKQTTSFIHEVKLKLNKNTNKI